MTTIQDVVNRLINILSGYSDIITIDYGSEYDNDVNGKYEYPMVFIECQPAQRTFNTNGTVTYNIALLILSQHKDEDKSNILQKQASTENILNTIIWFFQDSPQVSGLFITPSGPALSVSYATDTRAAGWRQEIDITVAGERCDWRTSIPLPPDIE